MRRIALVADLHGNLPATMSLDADLKRRNVDLLNGFFRLSAFLLNLVLFAHVLRPFRLLFEAVRSFADFIAERAAFGFSAFVFFIHALLAALL